MHSAKRPLLLYALGLILLTSQIGFSWSTRHIRPELGYVPTPPTAAFLQGISMGDDQFLFRALSMMIQNSGDTFGRFSALKLYNYKTLTDWFTLLDLLDDKSAMLPSMSAYYFSQTQNTKDVRYLVDYIYANALKDVHSKWWWLLQSIYLANHKLEDPDLALKVALPLKDPALPVMAQQMLAIMYEKRGEFDQAFDIILNIQEHAENIEEKDLRYMEYFAKERLHRLSEYQKRLKRMGKDVPSFFDKKDE